MFAWLKRTFMAGLSGISRPAAWFVDAITGVTSDSGIRVTGKSSLGLPSVWYAISKISGHVAQMPLTVRKDLDPGSEKAKLHPSYRLVRTRPNPFQTAAQMWETAMVHALLWGNAKIFVARDDQKRPIELLLIDASKSVTVYQDGQKLHAVTLDKDDRINHLENHDGKQTIVFLDKDVIHIPGLGIDGLCGLKLFEIAKNSIGLGLGGEKAANKDLANASRPGILIEAPQGVFNDEQDARAFMADFNKWHAGVDNVGRAGLLRENMKVQTIQNGSSTWVEQRKFQRQEVALLFLLESILGDDESVSYNSLEQKNLAYLSNCLMKWLVKIEQECGEKLLSGRQKRRSSHYFKFNTATLLRADFKTTIESLSIAVTSRIMSPNEAREKLDMNPYDGGDRFENPAISPGEPGSSSESPGNAPEDSNRSAILAHLKHRIGVESGHVLRAAGNQGNYIAWVDKFYERMTTTMENACENLGGDRQIGTDHCLRSKEEILEIAGTVTLDGLADAISEAVERWPERAEELTNKILNGVLIDA